MTNISPFSRNLPSYFRRNRQIYIVLILLCNGITLHAQTIIRGSVVDRENEPIPGVALLVKSTSSGTVTEIDGSFSLSTAEPLPFTLTVSFLGYRSEEIDVYEANSPIKITLTEDLNFLDEVVVVGYGKAKKSDYTGSVAVVGARELEKIEITSVGKA
ncbi:MAG: carboxypeptidase-like regulatory domain-containing protein, partial [Proteiniphilum sp.]